MITFLTVFQIVIYPLIAFFLYHFIKINQCYDDLGKVHKKLDKEIKEEKREITCLVDNLTVLLKPGDANPLEERDKLINF